MSSVWDPVLQRVDAEARQMRFGQLVVTVVVDVRDGQQTRLHPRYEQRQSIGIEDVKRLMAQGRELV